MLDEIPHRWYVFGKLQRESKTWEELTVIFSHTFSFKNENPFIHNALQDIHDKVLEIAPVDLPRGSQMTLTPKVMIKCYKVSKEPNNEDDLGVFDIVESEGRHDIEALEMSSVKFKKPLKIKEVNIGTKEEPKFASI